MSSLKSFIAFFLALAVLPFSLILCNAYESNFVKLKALVSYDGSNFRGWQVQRSSALSQRTVQGTLEESLSFYFKSSPPLKVVGAGRTDAEAHPVDLDEVAVRINKLLPDDVCVYDLRMVDDAFHAIRSAKSKVYSYRFSTSEIPSPFHRLYRTSITQPMNIALLNATLSLFVGTHDFAAFSGQIQQNMNKKNISEFSTVRTINSIELVEERPHCYRIDFHLVGALYKMVRNIVGTSLDASRSLLTLSEVEDLLSTGKSRVDNKSKPAPPEGLCLEEVFYQ